MDYFLDGYRCPKCESEEPFTVTTSVKVHVGKGNVSCTPAAIKESVLDDGNVCRCDSCLFESTMLSFKKSYQDLPVWEENDKRLVYYSLMHCRETNPLFNGEDIYRLHELAGVELKSKPRHDAVFQLFEETVISLCEKAKERFRDKIEIS